MFLILTYRLNSGPNVYTAQAKSPTATTPAINKAGDGPADSSRSARPAARGRIHQDDRFVTVEQRIGQVESPDAEIDHAHLLRQSPPRQALSDLHTKGIVAQEDVAHTGDQDARPNHETSGNPPM